jgi:hypothetical protein
MRMASGRRAAVLVMQASGRRGTVSEAAAFACVMGLTALGGCDKIDAVRGAAVAPARKAGLWEQVLTRDGKPGRLGVLSLCVDAATDHQLGVFGRHVGKGDCERTVARDSDGVYHFASSCTLSNGTLVRTMGTAAGDFGAGYRVHSEVNVSGAPIEPMNGMHVVDITGRYQGPCPTTMRPGDVSLGSGLKVNMDRLPQIVSEVSGG